MKYKIKKKYYFYLPHKIKIKISFILNLPEGDEKFC